MPVQKVKGGYRWGDSGKVYKRRADAERQGRAIEASKTRRMAVGGSAAKEKEYTAAKAQSASSSSNAARSSGSTNTRGSTAAARSSSSSSASNNASSSQRSASSASSGSSRSNTSSRLRERRLARDREDSSSAAASGGGSDRGGSAPSTRRTKQDPSSGGISTIQQSFMPPANTQEDFDQRALAMMGLSNYPGLVGQFVPPVGSAPAGSGERVADQLIGAVPIMAPDPILKQTPYGSDFMDPSAVDMQMMAPFQGVTANDPRFAAGPVYPTAPGDFMDNAAPGVAPFDPRFAAPYMGGKEMQVGPARRTKENPFYVSPRAAEILGDDPYGETPRVYVDGVLQDSPAPSRVIEGTGATPATAYVRSGVPTSNEYLRTRGTRPLTDAEITAMEEGAPGPVGVPGWDYDDPYGQLAIFGPEPGPTDFQYPTRPAGTPMSANPDALASMGQTVPPGAPPISGTDIGLERGWLEYGGVDDASLGLTDAGARLLGVPPGSELYPEDFERFAAMADAPGTPPAPAPIAPAPAPIAPAPAPIAPAPAAAPAGPVPAMPASPDLAPVTTGEGVPPSSLGLGIRAGLDTAGRVFGGFGQQFGDFIRNFGTANEIDPFERMRERNRRGDRGRRDDDDDDVSPPTTGTEIPEQPPSWWPPGMPWPPTTTPGTPAPPPFTQPPYEYTPPSGMTPYYQSYGDLSRAAGLVGMREGGMVRPSMTNAFTPGSYYAAYDPFKRGVGGI